MLAAPRQLLWQPPDGSIADALRDDGREIRSIDTSSICDPRKKRMHTSAIESMLSLAWMSLKGTDASAIAKMKKRKVKWADGSNTSPGHDLDLRGWA